MITSKMLRVTMPDGSRYDVPVSIIAKNRAQHYAHEFDNDIARSLMEDTIPVFEDDSYELIDWAINNMDWTDVDMHAERVIEEGRDPDFQEGWINGKKEIVD